MLSTIISNINSPQSKELSIDLYHTSNITHLINTILLVVSTVLAIPGNILVVLIVLKTPQLRAKAVNQLIVNLCIIDLITVWIDIPLIWTILEFNYNRRKVIEWLCKCQIFFHAISSSGQAFAFVSVGYERYHSISNPFDKEKTRYITHICIIFSWIISVIIAFIHLFLVPDTITYEFCIMSTHYTKHEAMTYIIAPLGLICFILIAFFYTRIVWLVRKHCKTANTTFRAPPITTTTTTDASTTLSTQTTHVSDIPSIFGDICVMDSKNRSLGRRRVEAETAKRSLLVMASFILICLPYPLLVLIEKLIPSVNLKDIYEWQYMAHTMSSLSAGLNPLLYGLANKQFRTAFCRICRNYYKRYKDGVLFH